MPRAYATPHLHHFTQFTIGWAQPKLPAAEIGTARTVTNCHKTTPPKSNESYAAAELQSPNHAAEQRPKWPQVEKVPGPAHCPHVFSDRGSIQPDLMLTKPAL